MFFHITCHKKMHDKYKTTLILPLIWNVWTWFCSALLNVPANAFSWSTSKLCSQVWNLKVQPNFNNIVSTDYTGDFRKDPSCLEMSVCTDEVTQSLRTKMARVISRAHIYTHGICGWQMGRHPSYHVLPQYTSLLLMKSDNFVCELLFRGLGNIWASAGPN